MMRNINNNEVKVRLSGCHSGTRRGNSCCQKAMRHSGMDPGRLGASEANVHCPRCPYTNMWPRQSSYFLLFLFNLKAQDQRTLNDTRKTSPKSIKLAVSVGISSTPSRRTLLVATELWGCRPGSLLKGEIQRKFTLMSAVSFKIVLWLCPFLAYPSYTISTVGYKNSHGGRTLCKDHDAPW